MKTRMVRAEDKTLAKLSKHCNEYDMVMAWVVTRLIKNWLRKEGVK